MPPKVVEDARLAAEGGIVAGMRAVGEVRPEGGGERLRFPLQVKLLALTTFVVAVIMLTVTWRYTLRQQSDRRHAIEAEVVRLAQSIATFQLLG